MNLINKADKFRPGTLNVQVNGVQIEDLYSQWRARTRECEELRKKVAIQNEMLKKQGKYIEELKEKNKNANQ